jgi:hypothetical protein
VPLQSEREAGTFRPLRKLKVRRGAFVGGALIIEGIVDSLLVAKARRIFLEADPQYLDGPKRDDLRFI